MTENWFVVLQEMLLTKNNIDIHQRCHLFDFALAFQTSLVYATCVRIKNMSICFSPYHFFLDIHIFKKISTAAIFQWHVSTFSFINTFHISISVTISLNHFVPHHYFFFPISFPLSNIPSIRLKFQRVTPIEKSHYFSFVNYLPLSFYWYFDMWACVFMILFYFISTLFETSYDQHKSLQRTLLYRTALVDYTMLLLAAEILIENCFWYK